MSSSLLQTKLYIPPARPELVARPRLIERLDEGLRQSGGFAQKLTLDVVQRRGEIRAKKFTIE